MHFWVVRERKRNGLTSPHVGDDVGWIVDVHCAKASELVTIAVSVDLDAPEAICSRYRGYLRNSTRHNSMGDDVSKT